MLRFDARAAASCRCSAALLLHSDEVPLVNVKPDPHPPTPQRLPPVLAYFAKDIRQLIRRMAAENPTWGEERIANK
jgi:hypothetical protein